MNRKIILLLFSMILWSCTKEIKIDFPKLDSKLVVNSLFTKNENIKIRITKTSLYDTLESNSTIKNAVCKLYCDDNFIEELTYKSDYYISSIKAKTGKKYRIEISCKGYDNVRAESFIPNLPSKMKFYITQDKIFEVNNNISVYYTVCNLNIDDNPNTKDFYLSEILFWDKNLPEQGLFKTWDFKTNDTRIISTGLSSSFLLFDDALFNGKSVYLKFMYDIPYLPDSSLIIFKTRIITEDLFKYIKTSTQQSEIDFDDINPFDIPKPINVYSNIKNGYGIFSGYNIVNDTIVVKN